MTLRQLPALEERIETGTVRFGDDWPCVVIRGDNALYFSMMLNMYLNGQLNPDDSISMHVIKSLVGILADCNMANHREG